MKLIAYQKNIFCLALLLCWSICAPPIMAQGGQDSIWIDISAPVQTVVVQTPRGNYSAVFQNQVRVYPNGSASGVLELSQRDGVLRRFLVFAGRVQFRDGIVIRVLLRTSEADTRGTTQGDLTFPSLSVRSLMPAKIGRFTRWSAPISTSRPGKRKDVLSLFFAIEFVRWGLGMAGMSPTLCNQLIVLLIGFVALSTFMTPHRCGAEIRPCFSPGSKPQVFATWKASRSSVPVSTSSTATTRRERPTGLKRLHPRNTKSFRTSQLRECIAFNQPQLLLRGETLRGSVTKQIQLLIAGFQTVIRQRQA
jgi:hypothetical protein